MSNLHSAPAHHIHSPYTVHAYLYTRHVASKSDEALKGYSLKNGLSFLENFAFASLEQFLKLSLTHRPLFSKLPSSWFKLTGELVIPCIQKWIGGRLGVAGKNISRGNWKYKQERGEGREAVNSLRLIGLFRKKSGEHVRELKNVCDFKGRL